MELKLRRDGEKMDSIPVNDWNAFVMAARAHQSTQFSKQEKRQPVIKDAGIFPIANSGSGEIELFSVVGLEGLAFRDVSALIDRVRFKTDTINPERVAVVAQPLHGNSGAPAVYDGLAPCRIKLNRDPSVFHSRATPVADETYMLADELGLYDILWHSNKKASDATAAAGQGDIVYAIVRMGQPVRQTVSVKFNYSSNIAAPDFLTPDYIYSGVTADTVYGSLSGSETNIPCWIIFGSGCKDMQFWESEFKLVGYFHGFYEKDDQTRPVITVPDNPVKKLFGQWKGGGAVDVFIDRSNALGSYSLAGVLTDHMGEPSEDAWIYIEWMWTAAGGWAWYVTGEACGDA